MRRVSCQTRTSSSPSSVQGLRVECRKGLVHEQDLRLVDEEPGNGDALLHASGELMGKGVGELLEAHYLEPALGPLPALALLAALDLEAELDVPARGAPGKERELLKQHTAVAPGLRHLSAVHVDGAARRGLEARGNEEERGLAAAGRAKDAEELTLGDGEVEAVERHDRFGAVAELLDDRVGNDLHRAYSVTNPFCQRRVRLMTSRTTRSSR